MGAVGLPRCLQEDQDACKRQMVRVCPGFLEKAVGRTARCSGHTFKRGVLFEQ